MQTLNTLLALNYGLRGAAVALLLLVCVQFWRDARLVLPGRLGFAFAFSAAAYALYFSPGLALPPSLWHLPLALVAQGGAVVFWLLMCSLFDDDFRLRPWHGCLWLGVGLLGIIQFFVLIPEEAPSRRGMATLLDLQPVLFALLGMWQAIAHWRADLIERRRQLRSVILVAAAANILLVALTKLVAGDVDNGAVVSLVEAAAVAVASFWVVWHLQKQGLADWWAAAQTTQEPAAPIEPVAAAPAPLDHAVVEALEALMTQERVYQEEDLSIGSLAQRLGVQEYQLRRLINQGMGYRNFNAFVNHYRLMEATAVLADPARRSSAVLNIAMDCGFGSLGPFNRAFKAQTGMTPTEYRKAHLPEQG